MGAHLHMCEDRRGFRFGRAEAKGGCDRPNVDVKPTGPFTRAVQAFNQAHKQFLQIQKGALT